MATGENSDYQLSQNNNTDLLVVNKLYDYNGENYINGIINVPHSIENTYNTALIKMMELYMFLDQVNMVKLVMDIIIMQNYTQEWEMQNLC